MTARVDWTRLVKTLNAMTVQIPEVAPDQPPPVDAYRSAMARVQNNRDKLDKLARTISVRRAEVKRKVDLRTELLRAERSEAEFASEVARQGNASRRRAMVEQLVTHHSTMLAVERARLSELDEAAKVVASAISSLQTAKETLNTLVRSALSEMNGERGSHY